MNFLRRPYFITVFCFGIVMRKFPHSRAMGFSKGPKLQVNNKNILPPRKRIAPVKYINLKRRLSQLAAQTLKRKCFPQFWPQSAHFEAHLTSRRAFLYSYFDKLASLEDTLV